MKLSFIPVYFDKINYNVKLMNVNGICINFLDSTAHRIRLGEWLIVQIIRTTLLLVTLSVHHQYL